MTISRKRLYVSTIDWDRAETLAAEYGIGLELAEFCEARQLDAPDDTLMDSVRRKTAMAPAGVFHAPFSELCPAAIDPLVRQVTLRRYRQSVALARELGIHRLVGGMERVSGPAARRQVRAQLRHQPDVRLHSADCREA